MRERPNHTNYHSLQRSNARGHERTVGQEHEGNRKPTYGYGKGVLEQATSFFITKFPEDVEMGDMWQAFVKCGRAIQIFIAQKRDRWGCRFGFARFLDVGNLNSLEAKLNQIKFGDQPLHANLARFAKGDHKMERQSRRRVPLKERGILSYAEALKGGKSETHGQAQRKEWQRKRQGTLDKSHMESWHGLEVKVEEEDMEWLRNSFVGFAKSPEIICNLQEKFLMEGYFSTKVTPMGSNMVLITCEDSEELKNLVETGRDWLAQWFTDTKPWNPELVAAERFTWLRCQGGDHGGSRFRKEEMGGVTGAGAGVASKEDNSEEDHGLDLLENGKSNAKDGNEEIDSNSLRKGKEGDRNETKLEVFDDKIAKSIWGDEHCAWVAKDARGRSGGIACVWNLDSFNMVRRIEGSGFIGMFGFWGKDAVPCSLINVYSSCDKQEKRIFWGELLDLIKANGGGNWCVGGDFNAVRDQEERSGRYIDAADMRGFNDFILGAGLEEIPMWRSFEIDGWGCYKLKEKLKMLKMELKAWNKEVFGGVDRNIDTAREEIKRLDEKEENGGLTSMEIGKRKENFHKLMEWSKAKDSMLFQKSRHRWLKEGDANTKYFHGCIVHRRKQNGITGLYSNGEWIEDVGEVKELARNYFKGKFEKEKWSRPTLEDLQFKKISEADNKFLISKFSTEEIEEAVWGCNGTKSPGPDGFNFNFIKKVWPVIKEDVYAFLAEFHENGKLVKGNNASFLVLIPKKDNPQSLGDYRPISLISSMYKIVSKILAIRLSKVLDLVISPNQTSFIGGRHIIDGIIITNEIIHEAKQSKKPMLVFKADFEKAYDSIN
ncbi:hypothetical protein SLEP1_g56570 [Rubroshorea leprosula]|uniref:Reverse transcriptase domain-containing protein n=1 Tax=Rubroshorea leprosula TaxID=152421 RepID=A0AAV5MK38_9ROSI|nr:hypothetical protein SLEP1_g56570 [Rubroshorea leprosula]